MVGNTTIEKYDTTLISSARKPTELCFNENVKCDETYYPYYEENVNTFPHKNVYNLALSNERVL